MLVVGIPPPAATATAIAISVRVRSREALGLRLASWRWILIGIGAGAAVWLVNRLAILGYVTLTGDSSNPQASLAAAANGSGLELAAVLAIGAVLVPSARSRCSAAWSTPGCAGTASWSPRSPAPSCSASRTG